MSALLAHMTLQGLWTLLGTVGLVLLTLGLMRVLFPDFSHYDASTPPGRGGPERRPPGAEATADAPGAELAHERGGRSHGT